jgi:predicted component of type VI protein secretion system
VAAVALDVRSEAGAEAAPLTYFDVKSPKRGAKLRLDASFFVIGRGERIPIFHDDPSISREHAAIVIRKEGVRVRDLGSKNGVLVNGAPIGRYAEVTLKAGDLVRVGGTTLLLCDGEPPVHAVSKGETPTLMPARRILPASGEDPQVGVVTPEAPLPVRRAEAAPPPPAESARPEGPKAAPPATPDDAGDNPTGKILVLPMPSSDEAPIEDLSMQDGDAPPSSPDSEDDDDAEPVLE